VPGREPQVSISSTVEHKELGATGTPLPEIALGTAGYSGTVDSLRRGIERGAFLVDSAELYGTEEVVGEAVKRIRDRVVLATKVSRENLKRKDLLKAADQSLRKLQTSYIDLYQVHTPNGRISIEETMGAMEDLVEAGKIRFIGVSNFTLAELKKAQAAMRKYRIVSNQVRYSLIERTIQTQLLRYCQAQRITIMAYSPLGSGLQHLRARDKNGTLDKLAAETGKTQAQIALNWCTAKEGVIAITKSNSDERMSEACRASGWRLSPRQLRLLDEGITYEQRGPLEIALRRTARRLLDRIQG
jgi:diketogulonate reductase-like aldo/keto reductase